MAKILTQEEIDALLSNVSEEQTVPEIREEKRKIVLYDFKHPHLVSKEQMRLLENIHEGICRNFGVFLSAQLRMIVEINLLAIDQIIYSEFVMSIAPPGCIYVCNIDKPYTQIILEMSPQLAIFIVEKLFGGQGEFVSTIRPISVIEQKIMRRVVDRAVSEITKNWRPISGFECSVLRFESNPEFVQIVPSSEPVVVVSMEIKIHGHTTLMNLCYPYMWVSGIISTTEVQERVLFGARESTSEEQHVVQSNLHNTKVNTRAILGRSKITIHDFVNLQVGDVVRLGSRIDSQIPIHVNNVHLFNGAVGKVNNNFACKITSLGAGGRKNGH